MSKYIDLALAVQACDISVAESRYWFRTRLEELFGEHASSFDLIRYSSGCDYFLRHAYEHSILCVYDVKIPMHKFNLLPEELKEKANQGRMLYSTKTKSWTIYKKERKGW